MKKEDTLELNEQELDQVTGGLNDDISGQVLARMLKQNVNCELIYEVGKLVVKSNTPGEAMRALTGDADLGRFGSKALEQVRQIMFDVMYENK